VWHQSNPVLSGVRWVIVIFYSVAEVRVRVRIRVRVS